MTFDGGSFRDPDGRVFLRDGKVLRGLTPRGAEEWRALSGAAFFKAAVADGRIVRSEERKSGMFSIVSASMTPTKVTSGK